MDDFKLSEQDRAKLTRLAQQESGQHRERAQAILLAEAGKTRDEIAENVRLTNRQIGYWLKQFEQHGSQIFPDTAENPPELHAEARPENPRPHLPILHKPGIEPDDPM